MTFSASNVIRYFVLPLGLLAILIFGILFFSAADSSLEAEKTLHAFHLVTVVVSEYLDEHEGEWPKTWNDLLTIKLSSNYGGWNWPNDYGEIKKRVTIDFSISTNDVAEMDTTEFKAISQIGINYGADHSWVVDLVNQAKGFRHGSNNLKKQSKNRD